MSNKAVTWKHIGLHGHSVGTFSCEPERIVWKSAIGNDGSSSRVLPASALNTAFWTIFGKSGHLRLQTKPGTQNVKHELRFDGFPVQDFEVLRDNLQKSYSLTLQPLTLSAAGTQYGLTGVKGKNLVFRHCVLDDMNEEGQEFEPRAEDEMLSLDLAEVTQCVLPGNNRNEIEVQFPESDAQEAGTDQLVSIRFYIPPDLEADPADKEAPTAAELLQQKIMQTANIRKTTGDIIVSFEQTKGTFLTPRGRYSMDLYGYFLRMRGQKYDYKIKYDDISRLFLLPKPDEVHMAFVIALDKPIRQGQQRYQYLVLQATKDPDEVAVNLDEETLLKEYNGELQPIMRGSLANLIAKTFKIIAGKKVFIPGKFANASQQPCVKCAVRANEGLLYPLEKQFVFIHKPPILVRFSEVESVEFQRYAGGAGTNRNFDLQVNLKQAAVVGTVKDYTFSGIDRADYAGLYNFLSSKKIPISNLQEETAQVQVLPVYNEDEIYGGPDEGGDEEASEDESYDEKAAAEDEAGNAGSGSDDDSDEEEADDDELGSEIDEDLDSDLEEHRKQTKRKKSDGDDTPAKKKPKKKPKPDNDDSDDEEASPKKKPAKKAKKDPNAPKRGMTAFFFFMNERREKIKEENPDIAFTEIAKVGGREWKALSAEAKQKYDKLAAKDKERYTEEMKSYVPPKGAESKGGGAKAKKKKDPNSPKRAKTSFLYFSNAVRANVKKENPDMSFGDLGKKIGEMFRALTPEEKEEYEEMAKGDQARYGKELKAYKSKKAEEEDDDDDDDEDAKPAAAADDSDADGLNDDDDDDDDDSD